MRITNRRLHPPSTDPVYGGLLQKIVDPLGRETVFTFDAARGLKETRTPHPSGTGVITTTHRSILSDGALATSAKPGGIDGQRTGTEQNGLPNRGPAQFQTDEFGNLKKWVDPDGRSTDYALMHGMVMSMAEPDPDGAAGATTGPIDTTYTYDGMGNVESVTTPVTIDPVTGTRVDVVHAWRYNQQFNVIDKYTDPENRVTKYGIDSSNGNVLWMKQIVGPEDFVDLPQVNSDALGDLLTRYEYTNVEFVHGKLQRVTAPNGAETLYDYYPVTRVEGVIVNFHELGRLQKVTHPTVTIADGSQQTAFEELFYDRFGNVSFTTDELGRGSRLRFDRLGRLIVAIQPDPDVQADGTNGPLPAPLMVYRYDTAGNLIRELDQEMTTNIYDYNPQNWVSRVTAGVNAAFNSDPTVREFKYDVLGRVIEETQLMDPGEGDHRITTWAYADALVNDLRSVTVTLPDPDGPTSWRQSPVYEYFYDVAGNLKRVKEPLDTALEHQERYEYDELQRLVRVTEPDPDGMADEMGLFNHVVTTYKYNRAGDVVEVIDPLNRSTEFHFDSVGRMDQMTLPDPDGATGFGRPVYDYTYDKNSNLVQVTDPDPDDAGNRLRSVTSFVFDARDRLTELTLGLKLVSPNVFDTTDAAIRRYEFDAAGQLTAEIVDMNGVAANARKTTHDYDRLGRVIKTTLPDPDSPGSGDPAPVWVYAFDAAGNQASVVDPRNQGTANATFLTHDKLHRQLTVTEPDPDAIGSGQATPITTFEYNDAGQVTRTRDPLNHGTNNWTTYSFDNLGRMVKHESPEPAAGGPRPTTSFSYDDRGRMLNSYQVIGALDYAGGPETDDLATYHGYDHLDRRIATQVQPLGLTYFQYDAVGNLTQLTDAVNNHTIWTYDGLDRVKTEQNQLQLSRLYEYDQVNNLTRLTDRKSQVRTFEYDTLYRRTAENWLNAQGAEVRGYDFTYNDAGETVFANDGIAINWFNYDHLGRVIESDIDHFPAYPELRLRTQLDHKYDAVGNRSELRTHVSLPGAGGFTPDFVNSYAYDNLSRMTQVKQEDQAGGNPVADKLVNFAYNAIGQFTDVNRFKDLAATQEVASAHYGYDNLGRLKDLSYKNAGVNLFTPYAWTYDIASRVTSFNSQDGLNNYGYNTNSELTSASIGGEGYTYDLNGNRTGSYTTTANNQLQSDGTYSYTYDAEGNRATRTLSGTNEVEYYTFDHRNRLTLVRKFNGATPVEAILNHYDAFDRRIARYVDATPTSGAPSSPSDPWSDAAVDRFVYDGDDVILDFLDADGYGNSAAPTVESKRYLHGAAVDQILAQEDFASGAVLWHLADNLGTVRDLVDNAGTRTHLQYDSFGKLLTPTALTRYLFTGQEYDPATALYLYNARWYDPRVGRFVSEDPIGFAGEDANLVRYVGNSPTNFIDPDGLAGDPVNGNTSATQAGQQAHKGFPAAVGGKGQVTLPNGRRADNIKETEKTIRLQELKPKSRVVKNGTLQGAKFEDAIRQAEGYADALPNPKNKVIYLELWGWVCEAGQKRFKYIKLVGWKKGSKIVPGAGTVAAVYFWSQDAEAKGLGAGSFSAGLDACPIVGTVKGVYEIVTGEDLIPDKDQGLPWYSGLKKLFELGREYPVGPLGNL